MRASANSDEYDAEEIESRGLFHNLSTTGSRCFRRIGRNLQTWCLYSDASFPAGLLLRAT